MSIQEEHETSNAVSAGSKKRKRPDLIADQIRERIVTSGLQVSDRVPTAWVDPEQMGASRGTTREALKLLEFQGLITTKTGPGGGVFVSAIETDHAIRFLDNLFLFEPPSIADIYALRKTLEPELAASVAGRLSAEQFGRLQALINLYEDDPKSADEEYKQRLAELDFHKELAKASPNSLLGFVCRFLLSLLTDKTECRAIYSEPTPWRLREQGINYQVRLLRALKVGDQEQARSIMRDHMIDAEAFMLERAVLIRP
ncbi:FadR family transcriptional regulator [Cohaesibacter sp. CAU 1516]|uniref:FadR/GntR family transcriptional regulator n=1 Tax=Cohaesibacter sp. CAU 1516 TaxID=2576038 RepID=UPI0010FD0CAB|nr:FCD domain-containing protein [Cohaesibacter sp. CAU 1516]TLP48697.1 FadR family transcriptional regulator [Cohaesibacter sp. CAU 1516]